MPLCGSDKGIIKVPLLICKKGRRDARNHFNFNDGSLFLRKGKKKKEEVEKKNYILRIINSFCSRDSGIYMVKVSLLTFLLIAPLSPRINRRRHHRKKKRRREKVVSNFAQLLLLLVGIKAAQQCS